MNTSNSTKESHDTRSNFIRYIVQRSDNSANDASESNGKPPKRIVQFWDNLDRLPADVLACIDTWKIIEAQGFERILFDKHQARDFISRELSLKHTRAYDKCYHPAMQSDYFRLCYILVKGGCYIDADDVYLGTGIQHFFSNGRLKIQPLCYDMSTHLMVPPSVFTKQGANSHNWIFYVNNNPLIACSGHPVIERALAYATSALEKNSIGKLPEIQSTTGPGNLTKSIFDAASEGIEIEKVLAIVLNWESIAKSRWELSYRNDARNWRLSNCQEYK